MEISETPKAVTGAANEEEGGHAKLEDMVNYLIIRTNKNDTHPTHQQ